MEAVQVQFPVLGRPTYNHTAMALGVNQLDHGKGDRDDTQDVARLIASEFHGYFSYLDTDCDPPVEIEVG